MQPNEQASCTCRFLETQANHSDSPIRFDSKLNEFYYAHPTSTGEARQWMIRFCPMCGGRAPESRRPNLFHRLSEAEQRRLRLLTRDLHAVQEVTAAFGEPDLTFPQGGTTVVPERDGKPETTSFFSELVYCHLSPLADVHVRILEGDRVEITFQGKQIIEERAQAN